MLPHTHTPGLQNALKYGLHMKTNVEGVKPDSIETLWVSAFLSIEDSKNAAKSEIGAKVKNDSLKSLKGKKQHIILAKLKPYAAEDNKLRENKSAQMPSKKIANRSRGTFPPNIVSKRIEKIFEIQTLENVSAQKIQRCWRHSKIIVFLRYSCLAVRMIVRIQKIIRGYLARRLVARYTLGFTWVVTWIQSQIRRHLSCAHVSTRLHREHRAAKTIQCMIRRQLLRCRINERLRRKQSTTIQALWRGGQGRAAADLAYLTRKAIMIQSHIRMYLSTRKVRKRRQQYNLAAQIIQSAYIHWHCCRDLSSRLIERELQYRNFKIAQLSYEESYYDERLTFFGTRFINSEIREKHKALVEQMTKVYHDTQTKHHDLLEFERQKDILSPVAIQRGWMKETELHMETGQRDLHALKWKYIFEYSSAVEESFDDMSRQTSEIFDMLDALDRIKDFKQQETKERFRWSFRRESDLKKRLHRQEIGEERRKWRATPVTKTGKPLIVKRKLTEYVEAAGMDIIPTTYRNYAIANEYMGRGGLVNLLASLPNGGNASTRRLLEPSVAQGQDSLAVPSAAGQKSVTDQIESLSANIQLQTSQNQINMYAELFQPIAKIFENATSKCPGVKGFSVPSQSQEHSKSSGAYDSAFPKEANLGYGSVGKDFVCSLNKVRNIAHGDQACGNGASYKDSAKIQNLQTAVSIVSRKQSFNVLPSSLKSARKSSTIQDNKDIGKISLPEVKVVTRHSRSKHRLPENSVIPWALLDELDGEKKRFENERIITEFKLRMNF